MFYTTHRALHKLLHHEPFLYFVTLQKQIAMYLSWSDSLLF